MNTSVLLLLIFCQLVSQLELIGQPFWGVLDPKPKLGKEEGLASCEIALFNTEWLIFFLYPQKEKKKEKKNKDPTLLSYHFDSTSNCRTS